MKRTVLAVAIFLIAGAAAADDAPKAPLPASTPPEPPKAVFTADEGKKLYEYGLKVGIAQGMARAAVEAAQQEVKPVLEKLQPPAAPKP